MDIERFCTCVAGLLLLMLSAVCGSNILISPVYGEGSHFLAGAAVGQGLADRGHNVTVLISRAYAHRATDPKYSNLSFLIFDHRHRSVQDVHDMFYHVNTIAFDNAESQMVELFSLLSDMMGDDCEGVLLDVDMMKQLEIIDAIVLDPTWICGLVMKALLERNMNHSKEIKMISLTPNLPDGVTLYLAGSYFNPAFQPELSTGYSNRMTFLQRITNIFYSGLILGMAHYTIIPPYQTAARNVGLDRQEFDLSLWKWHKYFDLHLINNHFASDFPFPLSPNVILIGGGLTVRPPAQLDQELEEFVNSSGNEGVIVFTLGTYFASVTKFQPGFVEMFAEAFRRLPQKVIWQLKELPKEELPPNVKALPWVPQNDLLAHPKLRVIMTHGGNNGFQEACYHGVPMIIIPFMADQYDVASRVEARGMGRKIEKFALSADLIYETIHDVINNPKVHRVHKVHLPSVFLQQVRHYDDFDSEFEQMKIQQVPDQEIPPAKDGTVYEVMNFRVQGFDCTLVEHFAQYAHNLAKNMELNIFDNYAMPTKATLVHTIQKPGTPEKEKVKDFTLHTHERVLQIQDLPSTTAPLFTEMLQLNLPEGVQMKIEPHTQEHYKERYIRKEIPDSLL